MCRFLCVLIGLTVVHSGCSGDRGFPKAKYDNMYCVLPSPDNYPPTRILSTRHHEKLAPVYMKLSNGNVYFLPDLTKENVEEFAELAGWGEPNWPYCTDRYTWFKYYEGRICYVKLHSITNSPNEVFRVSMNPEGPFHPLPSTKEELIAIFGEPLEWGYYMPPPGP